MPKPNSPEFSPLPNVHEVNEGEWVAVKGEGTLYARGISTCIAVSLYHPGSRIAMLGHFDADSYDDKYGIFPSFMDAAAHTLPGGVAGSQIWIGGGQLTSEQLAGQIPTSVHDLRVLNHEVKARRTKTLAAVNDELLAAGAELKSADWLQGSPAHISYSLDALTGHQEVAVFLDP